MASETCSDSQVSDLGLILTRLGSLGDELVPSLVLRQIDAWLSRPRWLYQGVEHLLDGPELSRSVRVRDKVRVLSNLLARYDLCDLIPLYSRAIQWPMGRASGLICSYSPDLGAAIGALLENVRVSNPLVIIEDDAVAGMRRLQLRSSSLAGPIESVVALGFAFQMTRFLTALVGPCPGKIEICFTWAEPIEPQRLPEAERAVFRFGAQVNAVAYPAEWDRLQNPMSDPLLWEMGLRMARAEATRLREQSVVTRVRDAVTHSLRAHQRPPSIREVATGLGKSSRSLERSLAEAGTMFRTIVEEERKQIAAAMLSGVDLSIQEISDSLGFSDRTSFTRSFRTWFSVPPAAFRLQLAAGRGAY